MFQLEIRDGIAGLTLARPELRNAIASSGWDALAATVAEADQGGARLIVVAGSGGSFCAGADLQDFPALRGDEAAAAAFRRAMRRGLDALAAVPVPTIALVEGPCYGAGVALALACDIRLAGQEARFAITPARMGISYPQEDVRRLVALVGRGAAARLLFTAAAIGCDEARRIGLADGRADELDSIAADLLSNDPESLAALKRGVALAGRGVSSDAGQDRTFDALLAADALAARLEARRRG
jgi:enoyl-CoA hydratase/carnithine racemase